MTYFTSTSPSEINNSQNVWHNITSTLLPKLRKQLPVLSLCDKKLAMRIVAVKKRPDISCSRSQKLNEPHNSKLNFGAITKLQYFSAKSVVRSLSSPRSLLAALN
jgi:hypothetical protein